MLELLTLMVGIAAFAWFLSPIAVLILGLQLREARRRTRMLTARVRDLEIGLAARTHPPLAPETRQTPDAPARAAIPPPLKAPERTTNAPDPVAPAPPVEGKPLPGPPAIPATIREEVPSGEAWIERLRLLLFGGNTLARVGVIILFFGFSFFLTYVAELGWFGIELRLGAAALAGIALLAIGWRLRDSRREYALALQGCGAGIVYLTAFAAVNLYAMIGAGVGLSIMLMLVALTTALAVRQDARSLAVLASLGGFLGPVLVTRDASHVALFSYYAALDTGIATVAWFRAWRGLNLLGFVFTFVIGAWWGAEFYQPHYFATTQPFLVFFFILFVAVTIMHAWRQPPRLTGYVDGTLAFGVPLAAYTLQHGLASGFEYGPAISALGFSAFYAVAAVLIRQRGRDWMRLLMQSFVALSAAFGTLAIPLAVDGSWTSAAWALEGAAVVWIGARQNRRLALLSGLALQFLAGCLAIGGQSEDALPVLNRVFLGHLMVSLAGLHSAWSLHRHQVSGLDARLLSVLTLAWGTVWWFGAGSYEVSQHLSSVDRHSATLGFLTISVGAYALLRSRLEWKDLSYPPLILLPAMVLLALVWFAETPDLLAHWGALAWPVAFLAQYWILRRLEAEWSEVASAYHCGTLYLGVYFVWREALWLSSQLAPGGSAWSFAIPALVPPYFVWGLATFRAFLKWPVERFREIYLGAGQIPLAIATTGCVLAASFLPGDPRPVPYIPLLNPVELAQVFSLFVLFQRYSTQTRGPSDDTPRLALSILGFVALNGAVARATHLLAGVPFQALALWSSAVFQTLLSVVWTTAAFAVMLGATRWGLRREWRLGAILLAATVTKLFLVDLADTGELTRIVSFLVVGGLILVIAYVSPLPPPDATESKRD